MRLRLRRLQALHQIMNLSSKLGILASFALVFSYPAWKTYRTYHHPLPVFALLVPEQSKKALGTRIWLKAAEEEGAPLEIITEEDFIGPFQTSAEPPRAILIPDEVAQDASSTLIAYLQNYVNAGGKLILVGDALMHEPTGRLKESFPAEGYFQFPPILGRVGDTVQLHRDTLRITDEWKEKLQIPPGQYSPSEATAAPYREFCTYQKLHALYPHWQNDAKPFTGKKILEAGDGSLIAGIQKLNLGEVLWINLPLSYLKRRTDGLLMHSFLRWISEDWVGLPRLLPVPDGIGGLVLNVHVDSNAALPYLTILKDQGFFENGPFSIHITAGPDARNAHDKMGFNLLGNPTSQEWIRYFVKKGDQVGSHGGWIHDFFGLHVGEKETPEFVGHLEKNFEAIKKFSGHAPVEYSAPLGNQPIWVNAWLRKKGYRSYYFVGDNGMGPTQNFRDDEFTDEDLWSFPVASFQQIASFEEADQNKVPPAQMSRWLKALSEFVARDQLSRLFYFHPPGIQFYQGVLLTWMKETRALAKTGRFKWYTMDQLSTFLTRRSHIHWQILPIGDHFLELDVASRIDLHKMVWRVSKNAVEEVEVLSGKVRIKEIGNELEIQPMDDLGIRVRYQEVPHAQ